MKATSRSRRRRNVTLAFILGSVAVAAILLVFWYLPSSEKPYKPGEEIDGLSAGLLRSIPEDYPKVIFKDVTNDAGISFNHFHGTRSTQLPEDMGSGAAWGDYNNDGWQDLFIPNEAGPLTMTTDEVNSSPASCVLYRNNGNGTFTDVSKTAGLDLRIFAMGAAWGDYNNDGWTDLFVSAYGTNRLFKNNRDGTFTEVSKPSGVGGQNGFWTGVSWSDFNRDGFLDIYVCGYVVYDAHEIPNISLQYNAEVPSSINPSSFKPAINLLYRNNGDGTFKEIAETAGVQDQNGRSLSASWCDLNEDGWPDLYVANDVSDNVLFKNLGDETFEEISHLALVADYRGAMGIGIGDWDNDADMDIFITHWIAQENALYSSLQSQVSSSNSANERIIRFMDEADRYGVGQIALDYVGFGTGFFDYNNDTKLDLFVVNGSTFQKKDSTQLLIPMQDQLFWNKGAKEGFYDVTLVSGEDLKKQYVGRGAAFADYDNDGDMDIYIANNSGPGILLRNDGGNENNWLKIRLTGVDSNTPGIGARLRIVTGDLKQLRHVGSQSSYLSQNSLEQHVGLLHYPMVDTLEVVWPSGAIQIFNNITANQTVEIIEGYENYKSLQ